MTFSDQTAREANIEAIVSFFKSGIKEKAERLGIELEHILVREGGTAVTYSEAHGVRWVLERLKEAYPIATYDVEGDLVGVATEDRAVTIEPASQLELSAGPFMDLSKADKCFSIFEQELEEILAPQGIRALTTGYHPSSKATDLELIPKRRYELMNAYLGAISMYGVAMMRGSAATQISIDYTSVEDCLRKLRIAFALVPALSLMCDNSPVFEGKPREHQLVRTQIWRYCDPDRCGIVPHVMDPDFSLEKYAAYILDTPAILAPCKDGPWCEESRTFGEIYATKPMTQADVEHALSMFFTDVRLKTYIEIRPADAMPVPYAIAYAALIKGLFYNEKSLDALDTLFAGVTAESVEEAKTSLMKNGYRGAIYGRPAESVVDAITDIAQQSLDAKDAAYLKPLLELTRKRTTLANLL